MAVQIEGQVVLKMKGYTNATVAAAVLEDAFNNADHQVFGQDIETVAVHLYQVSIEADDAVSD